MNDFSACLEYSLGEREQFDISILKRHFFRVKSIEKTDVETDKTGIDYVATLYDGSHFTIDAKTRQEGCSRYWKDNTPELCVEEYSDKEREVIGWLFKNSENHPDYILYTFHKHDSNRYYLIPYQLLRRAAKRYWAAWVHDYGVKEQKNHGWTSTAIFVPAPVLLKAIYECMGGIAQ